MIFSTKLNPVLGSGKVRSQGGGGGFFHSKGTWGCAAREGILFWTSSLAEGVLFGNFSPVKSRQGQGAFHVKPTPKVRRALTFRTPGIFRERELLKI